MKIFKITRLFYLKEDFPLLDFQGKFMFLKNFTLVASLTLGLSAQASSSSWGNEKLAEFNGIMKKCSNDYSKNSANRRIYQAGRRAATLILEARIESEPSQKDSLLEITEWAQQSGMFQGEFLFKGLNVEEARLKCNDIWNQFKDDYQE